MALGGATAGAIEVTRRAGARTIGAATAGWTRPERLTGTTRLGLGAVLDRPPRTRSQDGGDGGGTWTAVAAGGV